MQGVFAVQQSETGTDSGLISEAPLNPEYIAYKNTIQPFEWVKQIMSKDQLGYIPEPTDTTHLKGKKVSKKALEAEVQGIADVPAGDTGEIKSAPATYDLRTAGRVSPVKNQGSCGSCWAFASYGSMESEALPTQMFDFSENNLKNTHGFDIAPCSGGNAQMATAYLARWSGAVAESDDPYVDTSTSSPTALPVQEHAQEILMIPGRSGSLDNDNIKAALQTTGALYTTMYYSSTYYNTTSRAYYYSGTSGSNHAVTIVGWDDAYSRTNFMPAAPGDGAFIIKNSWGTSFGNNGYFYLSYYDSNAGKSLTAFTGESAANYNHVYQYDPLGWISSLGYGSDTAWAANVFTGTSGESLAAVGLSTNQVNTAYQVFIYTSPDQGPLNSAGPVSTVQGTIGIPGYHTIPLPTQVSLNTGQKFSVVVRLQTPNYRYPITIETPVGGYSGQATASAGQSYISYSGTTWTDLTTNIPNTNVCLKAYTVSTTMPAPVAAFSGTPVSGTAPLKVTFTDSSTGTITTRTWYYKLISASTWTPFALDGTNAFTFINPGTYDVQLTVGGPGGSNTKILPGYITVNPAPVVPVAAFSGTPVYGTAPLKVTFTDSSTGSITSRTWQYKLTSASSWTPFTLDGTNAFTFINPGIYDVQLTVSGPGGSNTKILPGYITVTAAPVLVKASFTASPVSGQPPLTVHFTDTSTGNPIGWTWDFGDGSGAAIQSPDHIYATAGIYTVSLTVTNAIGSNKVVKKNFIRVQAGKVRK